MTKYAKYSSLLIVAAAWLGGCASTPQYTQFPKDTDPSQETALISQQFEHAKSNQVDVYAPDSYAQAKNAFNDARGDMSANKGNEKVLDELAKSKAWLTQAETRSSQTQATLGEVVSARTKAVTLGAPTYSSSKPVFTKADDQVSGFSHTADSSNGPGKMSDQDRTLLVAQFQESQLNAIQQKNLGHAQAMIDQSRAEGAEKLAPQNLETAQAKYSQAAGVIRQNPEDAARIQAAAQEANQASSRLLQITRLAKNNQEKHPEAIAMASLGEQQAAAQLSKQNSALSEQKESMVDEARLTQTVKQVQAQLGAEEAQVFEDGKQVHIRLKGMNFPSGSATIQPDDYALMGKVGDAVKATQPTSVRIEGRTDSVGGKATNQKLSDERANAVKDFLVASKDVDPGKITSEGYGSSKPIASEKTAAGRKLNRSVDVLLVPDGAMVPQAAGQTSQAPGQAAPATAPTQSNSDFNSIAK